MTRAGSKLILRRTSPAPGHYHQINRILPLSAQRCAGKLKNIWILWGAQLDAHLHVIRINCTDAKAATKLGGGRVVIQRLVAETINVDLKNALAIGRIPQCHLGVRHRRREFTHTHTPAAYIREGPGVVPQWFVSQFGEVERHIRSSFLGVNG